jgi:hypothetical protein
MNRITPIGTVHSPRVPTVAASGFSPVPGAAATLPIGARAGCGRPTGETGAPNLSTLITADASQMSGRDFLDALGLSSPEHREARRQQDREQCIRLIEVGGSLRGFPPVLVAECRQIIAEREGGWALAERSAFGMSASVSGEGVSND